METVIKCEKVRDWRAPDGKILPIYSIGLSDGQGGESFGEIPLNTPMSELTITPNTNPNYPSKIKWNKPNTSGGFKKGGRGGNESFALSYAKDVYIAKITKGETVNADQIIAMANTFFQWMETKKSQ